MTTAITDFGQFATLRAEARRDDPAALREVASQFEALFVQSLMKNMRGARLAEPMFGSEQMDMYQDMFDQQLSLEMASGRGLGLAEMLVRQLGGTAAAVDRPAAGGESGRRAAPAWSDPQVFVRDVWPHAERAGRELGVAPRALVAQAALETGWGRQVPGGPDGGSSHNLFGIKAGRGWQGDSVARATLEFEDGVARRRVERFRAYPDVAAAFDDYVALLGGSERYAPARGRADDTAAFTAALQAAGYATDPRYAEKLDRVLAGDTLRQALTELKNSPSRPIASSPASIGGD